MKKSWFSLLFCIAILLVFSCSFVFSIQENNSESKDKENQNKQETHAL